MKACKEYDNKTGKCAKDSENPCPVGGDEDKCELREPVFEEDLDEIVGKAAREAVEGKDPTIEIVKRVLELVKDDTPLREAFIALIDAQTKRILAEATWRNALALKHMKKSDTEKVVEEKD